MLTHHHARCAAMRTVSGPSREQAQAEARFSMGSALGMLGVALLRVISLGDMSTTSLLVGAEAAWPAFRRQLLCAFEHGHESKGHLHIMLHTGVVERGGFAGAEHSAWRRRVPVRGPRPRVQKARGGRFVP